MDLILNLYKRLCILPIIAGLLAIIGFAGCSDEEEIVQSQYGYVQFKLVKSASYGGEAESRSTTDKLPYLGDAKKLEVVLQYDGSTISQTLVLNSYNAENAEFGLRSDKLQLLVGDYVITGYRLYDNLDQLLLSGEAEDNTFSIIGDGVTSKALPIEAIERGMVSFKLVKDIVKSRAAEAYPFSNIQMIDVSVKNTFTKEVSTVKGILVTYTEDFKEGSADETLYPGKNAETAYAVCDTVAWLRAGTYQISSYTTYSDKKGKNRLETATVSSNKSFVIKDNEETKDVEVPIKLAETDAYIQDYIALKAIWEKMNGKNWSYYGEAEAIGANWNFNKDIDMWGVQPGVNLNSDGRVVTLSLIGFGAEGDVPDEIGQLTELEVLYLGAHDELLGGYLAGLLEPDMSAEKKEAIRWDYNTRFRARDVREGLSDILQDAINRNPEMKPILKSNRINKKDVQFGNLSNGITGISKAFMRLTKLESFYIANSPITIDGFFKEVSPSSPFYAERNDWDWSNLDLLSDIEIYNCPNLTALPTDMLANLPEVYMLNLSCNKGISGEQLKADWEAIIEGPSGSKIQLLYIGYNNLKETPDYDHLKTMTGLGLLDLAYNQLEKIHPFGKEIIPTQMYLDYNNLTEIPHDDEGYFFGYSGEMESFTCSHNKLTKFPDIFNAKSVYIMGSIDFSYNQISEFENGDDHRGINVSNVNLAGNRLKTFPGVIFKKNSVINSLNLAGNGMEEIPEGSLEGKYAYTLVSLDLSYNKLSDLPEDFYPMTLPYLYGLDISYNCFSEFPYEPLNIDRLTVLGIRHQRDDKGNRILRTWPTGIYQCPSLVALYIGSNDLRKIEDTISPYIYLLEIKDNPNISIDMTDVCPYIEAGMYTLIYDKTQDIRGCAVLDLEN